MSADANGASQYSYSVVHYLNEATVLLRMRTADVVPKWEKHAPSVKGSVATLSKLVEEIATSTTAKLEQKIVLTHRLHAETSDAVRWDLYNQMSGLFNAVKNLYYRVPAYGKAQDLSDRADQQLSQFDRDIAMLASEADVLKNIMQGVAVKQLTDPVPANVTSQLNGMHDYNERSKARFWMLLDGPGTWNIDQGRIGIIHQLQALRDYPQVDVLWARFLLPQVEAIERQVAAIAVEAQLARGSWQQVRSNLRNVAYFMAETQEGRMAWYHDPFCIAAKTQLRLMQKVAACCAG